MQHLFLPLMTMLWTGGNFYLWSLKQAPTILFWEALGVAALAYPMLFLYVTRWNSPR